jgi:aspartate/methionine/tyrosine aminotransferase
VKLEGALYTFARLDPEVFDIQDDEQLVLDLLLQEKILVTQAPASIGPHRIACASRRCPGHVTWPTPSNGWATS